MRGRYRKGFNFGDFEITKREIIASISIIAVMLVLGFVLSGKISEHHMDKVEQYNKAAKLTEKELFQYGMDTNIGNALVQGELKAVDTVTYPEIGGQYMYVEKEKQEYTMHTRIVSSGKGTTVQTYWTWDTVGSESLQCKKISFCGIVFDSGKIKTPYPEYLQTINKSSKVRYEYYGTPTTQNGTIFTTLKDGTINSTRFYNEYTIQDVEKSVDSNIGLIIFWIFWVILMFGCVYAFYYAENNWLE